MKRWVPIATSAIAVITTAAAVALAVGGVRWGRGTVRAVGRLTPPRPAARGVAAVYGPEQLVGLPAPVARYFTFALTPGQALVHYARFEQRGDFATRPGAWRPFTAFEHVTVTPPGFVWDATIRMAPLAAVRVRDSYLDGAGAMDGRLAGLVPIVRQGGTPEMAEASLQRYLAEAPWVPTALLPAAGVTWTAVDDSTARATLVDGATTARVEFRFGARGEIVGVAAERYRDVRGTPVRTAWTGRFWDYARVDGMMVPRQGEVAWVLPDGPAPYWRGQIAGARYERVR